MKVLLLISLLASSISVSALSTSDIQSVFGSTATGLTGNTINLPNFVFSVVTNSSHALVSLNATTTPLSRVGWMATGVGTAMANADFLITWPNPSSSSTPWTLSHRQTTGEVMPVVASSPSSQYYTLIPSLSSPAGSTTPYTVVSYLRLLAMPAGYATSSTHTSISTTGSQSFIYASCTVNPASTSESATLTQHDQAHNPTSLDLSQAITLASPGQSSAASTTGASRTATGTASTATKSSTSSGPFSGGGTTTSTKRSKRDMYLIAHATLGSLALVLFTPVAILIGRLLRSYTWFPAHRGLQLLATVLVIAAFGIGVSEKRGKHFDDTHTRLGLSIFIIVLIQVGLGAFAHSTPGTPANSTSRLPTLHRAKSPVRLLHIFIGIAILALGFAQVHLGFDEWQTESDELTRVPKGVRVVYWILVGVTSAAWGLGWTLEARGGNRPRTPLGEKVASHSDGSGTP
ncbi:hypothetical protein T439DRAFT_61032 [Meredithblackwellia eburnea MCA 4105]